MILPIKIWPDPILMKPCQPWDFEDPPLVVNFLMADMIETMAKSGGIGLAANQVGISYRVIAMHVQETGEYITLFNPEIVSVSELQYIAMEGCLSFPKVMLDISRPKTVEIRYVDHFEREYTRTFSDIDAKCVLHEIDHLDGKTFKEYVSPLKFSRAIEKGRKR
jgi:peptide deformylase